MKTEMKHIVAIVVLTLVAGSSNRIHSQGMPAEARANIHALFSQHTNVTRTVTMIKDGYVAVTESKDPKLAKVLREHVSQMRKRLQSGRMVRGWDPAFREMVEHYDDITHRVETTKNGLKITVKGKTPEAIKVAKNHANIVSNFAKKGWGEHDVRHPRALAVGSDLKGAEKQTDGAAKAKACCQAKVGTAKKSCCGEKGCKRCKNPGAEKH